MKLTFKIYHAGIYVLNLEDSLNFYKVNLHMQEVKRLEFEKFTIVYLKDELDSEYRFDLTYIKNRAERYNLGENEVHFAYKPNNFEEAYALHLKNNVICYENKEFGMYFIEDPDGYWIEISPPWK